MSLKLYFHPLSSFCHKVLIALYENGTAFTPHVVDLSDPAQNAAFKKIWPIGKFPVLRDEAAGRTIPESTSIIEYLAHHYPGRTKLVPDDPEAGFLTRAQDRFYDLNIHIPMQKFVTDRIRPAGKSDGVGVEQASSAIKTALSIVDKEMFKKPWAAGESFSMADCAAAPALFYVNMAVDPLAVTFPNAAAYLNRLMKRPSFARVLDEAKPYLHLVPR